MGANVTNLVVPEFGNMVSRIRVPVSVLPTWYSVHIQDCVNALSSAQVYNTVQPLQTFWLQHTGVQVILKMSVVEGNSNTVESEFLVESGI